MDKVWWTGGLRNCSCIGGNPWQYWNLSENLCALPVPQGLEPKQPVPVRASLVIVGAGPHFRAHTKSVKHKHFWVAKAEQVCWAAEQHECVVRWEEEKVPSKSFFHQPHNRTASWEMSQPDHGTERSTSHRNAWEQSSDLPLLTLIETPQSPKHENGVSRPRPGTAIIWEPLWSCCGSFVLKRCMHGGLLGRNAALGICNARLWSWGETRGLQLLAPGTYTPGTTCPSSKMLVVWSFEMAS